MLFHEQPTDPWIPFDFMILEAYQRLQDEICPKCGHPVWLCRSKSNSIGFKTQTGVCYATREQQRAEAAKISDPKARQNAMKDKKHWGEFLYTVPYIPPNAQEQELPTRTQYYEDLARETNVTS